MNITLARPPAPQAPPALPHDALACGITRETSCPACAAAFEELEPARSDRHQHWQRLRQQFPDLGDATGTALDDAPPEELSPGEFGRVVGSLCRPELREVLVGAVVEEVGAVARQVANQAIDAARGQRRADAQVGGA